MNGRYLETRRKYAEASKLIGTLVDEIQKLDKQIEKFNELQAKVRQDTDNMNDEELAEYEKICEEAKSKLPEIEKAQKEKAEKQQKFKEVSKEQSELYKQMQEENQENKRRAENLKEDIMDDELESLNEEQEKINKEIEEKEKRKELIEQMIQNLHEQKFELDEEYNKLPSMTSMENITEKEIEDRIKYATKCNEIKKDLDKHMDEIKTIDSELADLYKQKQANEKLISKREKQVQKEEKKEAKAQAKIEAQKKTFDEICESDELLKGKKLEEFLILYNGLKSQMTKEEEKELNDKYNAKLDKNNEMLSQKDSKVKVKEPKVKTKEVQKVTPEKCTVAKGMLKTMKNFGTKFKNGIGKVVELGVSAAAAIYNGVTKSKQRIAELEAELAQANEKNDSLTQENDGLTQENANLSVENSEIKARTQVEIDKLSNENKDLKQTNSELSREKIILEQDKRDLKDEIEIQTKMGQVLADKVIKEQEEKDKQAEIIQRQKETLEKMKMQMKALQTQYTTPQQTEDDVKKLG